TQKLMERLPDGPRTLPALVWPWSTTDVTPTRVADKLPQYLGERPPQTLIPFLPRMSASGKRATIEKLAKQKKWDDTTRATLFRLISDREKWVRSKVFESLKTYKTAEPEAQPLEPSRARKPADMRRGVLNLLFAQKLADVLASADRLLAMKKADSRLGGLELC